jgi:hypothetical protein
VCVYRRFGCSSLTDSCFATTVHFVDQLLQPLLSAPSKIKPKLLKEIAHKINRNLGLIGEKNFLGLAFLSEEDPFEAALKQQFGPQLADMACLFGLGFRDFVDDKFFYLLENNLLIASFARLKHNDLSCFFLPDGEDSPAAFVWLAKTIWFMKLEGVNELAVYGGADDDTIESDDVFTKAYIDGKELFEKAWPALQEYDRWVNEHTAGPDAAFEKNSRLRAVCRSPKSVELLVERKFELLGTPE